MKKSRQKNKLYTILLWFCISIIFIMGVIVFFTSTRPGLRIMTDQFLPDFIEADDIIVGDVSGNLSNELTLKQVELKNLNWFPMNTVIRIQRLTMRLKSLDPKDAEIDFENIRLFMPYSDPIVLSGQYRNGQITANVYSSNISVEEILSLLPNKIASQPKGVIKNIDLYVQGPVNALNVKGAFIIEEFIMPNFVMSQAPGDLTFVFRRKDNLYSPSGELKVSQGKVKTKNALLKLQESRLFFSGSFIKPVFDIRGSSSISKVDMDVVLMGTPQSPIWKFSSNPPLEQEVLLLMFLTGKNMAVVQNSVEQQRLTPDLAKDMVDYFLLGGEGGRLAQKLGIKDVSIIYDKDNAGFGVKKEVTSFLDVGYQLEQKGLERSQATDLKHTLGAEFKLNSRVSLEVDKELYQFHNQQRFNDPLKPEEKIILKYKTQF